METNENSPISNTEKHLFSKMLGIGVDPEMAKKIMSFWMFLQTKGFKDIHKIIVVAENNILRCVCAEAEVALAFLECESDQARPKSSISCPITWRLAGPYLSPIDVLGDKERAFDDVLALQNNVYNTAFEDILDKIGEKGTLEYPNDKKARDEGTSENSGSHASKLNPFAKEWNPVSEDERSLFMTFSKGCPLFKAEIVDYFQRQYGDCVEDVFIHMPRDREPEFGKIVFKFSWILNLILQNNESMTFYIGGKTICLKKYKAF